MKADTFCISPWVHTCVYPTGKLAPCCVWKGPATYSFTEFDSWINSTELKNVRKDLNNGIRINPCSACWNDEDIGKKSLRQIYNDEFLKDFQLSELNNEGIANNTISTFDLKLGNLCNLKCVMCNGNSSSQLMTEYKTYSNKFSNLNFYKTPNTDDNFSWPDTNEFKEFLDKFKKQIRWIKFTGGEPVMNPYIIELLKEIPEPELVTISITTNGTKLNQELLSILSKFKKLWISVSLEGIEQDNDQIRYLSNWDEVSTNTLTLSKLPNAYFNINYVFQCFSVTTLIPLLLWCDIHNLKIQLTVLSNPIYLTINSVEPAIVNEFKNKLLLLTSNTNQVIIDNILELLKSYTYNSNLNNQRIEYLKTLDDIRGTNLCNII